MKDDDEGDGDLFGSDDEAGDEAPATRKLDDEDLDSGDDLDRHDRDPEGYDEDVDYNQKAAQIITYDANLQRMKDPEITDDELYLVNLPSFLGIESENFDPSTYIPPSQGHTGQVPTDTKFSPFTAASSSLFWRHDPADSSKLQSSARIIRWSDGSLTLQLASSPKEQFKVSATTLRQVQPNPKKPLPIHAQNKAPLSSHYDPNKDAHVYLAAAHTEDSMYRIVAPVTASLKILPTGEQNDHAMMKLQSSLAKAAPTEDPVSSIREIKEDPELAKKRAELAEKEKLRAQRRRENQEQKEFDRKKTVLGRRGVRSGGVGLTISGLEDDFDDMRPTKPKKPKRKANRHGEIYTDDEDEDYGRGRTREDEYDEDDGFLVGSDEEPEVMDDDGEGEREEEDDDPDVDDLEIEGRETVLDSRSRAGAASGQRTPPPTTKRRELEVDDNDEPSTARDSPHARKRGKRVVESDEEEGV